MRARFLIPVLSLSSLTLAGCATEVGITTGSASFGDSTQSNLFAQSIEYRRGDYLMEVAKRFAEETDDTVNFAFNKSILERRTRRALDKQAAWLRAVLARRPRWRWRVRFMERTWAGALTCPGAARECPATGMTTTTKATRGGGRGRRRGVGGDAAGVRRGAPGGANGAGRGAGVRSGAARRRGGSAARRTGTKAGRDAEGGGGSRATTRTDRPAAEGRARTTTGRPRPLAGTR